MLLTEGMYLQERYEILEKIGVGGMSVVYKAKDHTLNRNVAIKVLKSELSQDENFLSKFRSEAQSAASLEHPNIVNVYDVGQERGLNFIVMEYVEGITLKTYIEKKGQIGFKEAVSIAIQVAKGLEAAHNKSIIHRDIKPQNIIISTEGKVKVTDFGIARAATSDTIHSDVMGSVHYASPEQARNGFMDGKSDIYSLGIVMYEMVTGRVPFDAETTVAVALMHLQEEMVRPSAYTPDLPVSLEGIILKCTQKSPDRRYESMAALLDDLKRALVQPDKNFAVVPQAISQKTTIVSAPELEQLREENAAAEEVVAGAGAAVVGTGAANDGIEAIFNIPNENKDDDDDDDDEEGFLPPAVEKAIIALGIIIGIVILAIIILLVGRMTGIFGGKKDTASGNAGNSTTVNEQTVTPVQENKVEIEVPSLIGYDRDVARDILNEADLGFFVNNYEYSDEIEEDAVISQSIDPGEMVEPNTTISVVLSLGSKSAATIPNCVGSTESTATTKLKSLGISYTVQYEKSSTVDAGIVISQNPSSGNVTSGTKVVLTVSQGQDTQKVPDVVGMSQSAASSALTNAGFVVGSITTENSDTVAEGNVISQSIAGNKQAVPGTSINLVVSKGKADPTVPNFSFNTWTKEAVEAALKDRGFVLDAQYRDSTADKKDILLEQDEKTIGQKVPKGTKITCYFGNGNLVTVPSNLVGGTVGAAKDALSSAGFTSVDVGGANNDDIVDSVSNAGNTVAKTTTITITSHANAPATVSVTGVTLNKASTTIVAGETETLTATVEPSNASNSSVTWSSSDSSVATVSGGTVTGVAAGTATITVTTADGSKTATCEVTVTAAP